MSVRKTNPAPVTRAHRAVLGACGAFGRFGRVAPVVRAAPRMRARSGPLVRIDEQARRGHVAR